MQNMIVRTFMCVKVLKTGNLFKVKKKGEKEESSFYDMEAYFHCYFFENKLLKHLEFQIPAAMLEMEAQDLSDDADYAAASQEGMLSSKKSSFSDLENAEIVYLKEKVTINPTQYAADRISGKLKLIKQDSSLFMTWMPYKSRISNARLSERDKSLYTIKPVSFTDIQSIRVHTPKIGWQYAVVILSSGLAYPPLYFYNGGVQEFLATIKQHVYIVRSSENTNLFHINNFEDPLQFDKISLVWGKPRQSPLQLEEWGMFLDAEGRVVSPSDLKKRIFYGGVDHSLRKEIWKFLLGFYAYDSTYTQRRYLSTIKKSEYETLKNEWQSISISTEQSIKETQFKETKFLIDKDVVRTDRMLPFYEGDENENVNILRDILMTYSFYNFEIGYCQGMNDFLSPILYVMEDESEAFWCFVYLMERFGPNFKHDQSGMKFQFFALSKLMEILDKPLHDYFEENNCLNYLFCFRWILVQFKREFEYEEIMRLWEILWTHYPSEHLHLYICIAILKTHRIKIMGELMDFDTLFKYINELSCHIDLDSVLSYSEALCMSAGKNGAAAIPPGTPPVVA
ncbi:uncharacterized protein LOC111881887 isoform X2 [Lactuca sativa]|uniref:TBC1 domain family member 15 n=1 Tax=Lactuca sativa TaxID=4236 RepID=A0A9R1VFZ8_LACSA|nr:uncharacterized protein LOC111881887 isoform X2 [Lactuca sativa]KAJ0204027.1 hypothetical protein LSAT_V11C500262890 [Lactuca sativa]